MAEATLTSWLDPVFEYFAREAGISTEEYSSIAGSQGIGASVEILSDLFLQPLTAKVGQGIAGLATLCYGIWGKPPSKRLQKELIVLGNHMLTRIIDPKPSDIIAVRQNIDQLVEGIKAKDMAKITGALLRSPAELGQMLRALGAPVNVPAETPSPRPEIPEITPPPTPTPAPVKLPIPSPITPPAAPPMPPKYTLDSMPAKAVTLGPKYMH